MKLLKYIFKRVVGVIPILIIISFVSFGLMNLAPGDPAEAILTSQGAVVTSEVLESTRVEMGLDKPFSTISKLDEKLLKRRFWHFLFYRGIGKGRVI